MMLSRAFACGIVTIALLPAGLLAADDASTQNVIATPPVFVPAPPPPPPKALASPLPDTIVTWDAVSKQTNVTADAALARFTFNFTNISTNDLTIVVVHPTCGCTTTELPPLPWTVAPGASGQIRAAVNVAGRTGLLVKSVDVATDRGSRTLILNISILPPVFPILSQADRTRNQELAKADRQAVFRGDCVKCHVTPGDSKYGKALFDADCAICHESERRAAMVPDLHSLKDKTNIEFWRTWIAHGKPGTLMPAFSMTDGGPLSDIQIVSVANYLNSVIPPQPTASQ